AFFEFGATVAEFGDEGNWCAFVGQKPVLNLKFKGFGKLCIVAEFRMGIEWQVSAVNRKIATHGSAQAVVVFAGNGDGRRPEHSMMDNEEINTLLYGFF